MLWSGYLGAMVVTRQFFLHSAGDVLPDKIFIPIGNYILLENDNFSILDERSLTTQAVGYMLKNPMVHVTSIKDIKEGHSITNYVKFLTKDSFNIESRPKIITTEAFQPKIDDDSQIRVIWEELSDSRCDLKLIARGKFLLPHMSSGENDFTGSPFNQASPCEIVSIFFIDSDSDLRGKIKGCISSDPTQ